MLSQEELKKQAANYALKYLQEDMVLGVGSGSTVAYFIQELTHKKDMLQSIVSSSDKTTELLKAQGLRVSSLNSVGEVDLYIDGADEVNSYLQMIKGGGAALTREKILASASRKFICIVDESKVVNILGEFPVAVEVIPEARSYVAREIVKLGGSPNWREGVVTDNGNWILDVYNLSLLDPLDMEIKLNSIAGVVDNGIFATRTCNEVVIAKNSGEIEVLTQNIKF